MTPITRLINSCTHAAKEVEVENPQASSAGPLVEVWSFEQVKRHFECSDGHSPIICPKLMCNEFPSIAMRANLTRSPSKALLGIQHDPYFLGQHVLGQKGAVQVNRIRKFDTYFALEEGSLLLMFTTKPLAEEDEAKLEQDGLDFDMKDYQIRYFVLHDDMLCIIPAKVAYSIYFVKDSLFTMGNIVPASRETDHIPKIICDTCRAIPFDRLPFEEDPGYPHKRSVQGLRDSAKTCKLCCLILDGVKDARKDFQKSTFETIKHIGPISPDNAAFTYQYHREGSRFGVRVSVSTSSGKMFSKIVLRSPKLHRFNETVNHAKQGDRVLARDDICERESRGDSTVRPWLYGNWWTLGHQNSHQNQLIGFGVRLSRNPKVHNDEDGEYTVYRGSDIRIIAEPCTICLALHFLASPPLTS